MQAEGFDTSRWHAPPIATFYGSMHISDVVARTTRAVVVLSEIRVYRSGCLLDYTAAALRDPEQSVEPHAELKEHFFSGDASWLPEFEVRLPDGTCSSTAETVARRLSESQGRTVAPEPPVLSLLTGAAATSGDRELEFHRPLWLWPLPPAEEFEMAITWPRYDIAVVHSLDGARIRELASRSRPFWDV